MYYYFIHLDRGTIDFLDTTVYTFIKKARKFPLSLKKRKQGEPSTLKAKRSGNTGTGCLHFFIPGGIKEFRQIHQFSGGLW